MGRLAIFVDGGYLAVCGFSNTMKPAFPERCSASLTAAESTRGSGPSAADTLAVSAALRRFAALMLTTRALPTHWPSSAGAGGT